MNQFTDKVAALPAAAVHILTLCAAGLLVHACDGDATVLTLRLGGGESAYVANLPESVVFMAVCVAVISVSEYVRTLALDTLAWWRA